MGELDRSRRGQLTKRLQAHRSRHLHGPSEGNGHGVVATGRFGNGIGTTGPVRASCDIPVPSGHSSLEVALAVVDHLVEDYGAVVTETDIHPDGMGSLTLRISMPASD